MPKRRTSELDARLRAEINRLVDASANKDVAKAIGRDPSWLTRYRSTNSQPDIPTLFALMRIAGWTVSKDLSEVYTPASDLVPWLRDGLIENAVRTLLSIEDPQQRLVALNSVRIAAKLPPLEQAPESTSVQAPATGPRSARGRRRRG